MLVHRRVALVAESSTAGCDAPEHGLSSLVKRIAARDRVALGELYDGLADPLFKIINRVGPVNPHAILAATFVEIWLLARFHVEPEHLLRRWFDAIAARRTAESVAGQRTATDDCPWWSAFDALHERRAIMAAAWLSIDLSRQ